jgi:hypothetical protein
MGHKRDWKQYNKQLVNRGKINLWVNPDALEKWTPEPVKKNGHPFLYSNELIKTLSCLRFRFRLSLRETEGFFQSFINALKSLFRSPSYTQICRRMKILELPTDLLTKKNITDIALDTTGLKVYGEGEWRAEKYGGRKRWKKLHLALDAESGKLIIAEVTDEYVHDTTYVEKALKIAGKRKSKLLIDGIADSGSCYRLAKKYNKVLLTLPKKGAILREEIEYESRNEAIRIIRGLGGDLTARSIWGKLVEYNRRMIAESMMARWKRLYGGDLKSRCAQRGKIEVRLKAMLINTMIDQVA